MEDKVESYRDWSCHYRKWKLYKVSNRCFGPVPDSKYNTKLYEIRNLESCKGNGKTYVETYHGPITNIGVHSKWLLQLNSLIQGNDFDLWWPARKYLYYKQINQPQQEQEMKKDGEKICVKLINGYSKNLNLYMNIPIGIQNFVVSYLMVDICSFRDFYVIFHKLDHGFIDPIIYDPPSHSLISRNIKWKSKWTGPTGEIFKTYLQVNNYDYNE